MNTIIDCRGLNCPEPVLKTRDALAPLVEGAIEVLVDNKASLSNVERFGKSQGCGVESEQEADFWRIRITKQAGIQGGFSEAINPEDYACTHPQSGGMVMTIPSDTMGRGNDELGRVLMRAFIKTIKDIAPQPEKIFLYNTGVRLTATDNDCITPLKDLEKNGVAVFSCGTCLDFLGLKEELRVGETTNMYDIMSAMAEAAKVISPY